jgi:hypothetical protein
MKTILSLLFAAVTFSQIFAEDVNPFAGAKNKTRRRNNGASGNAKI